MRWWVPALLSLLLLVACDEGGTAKPDVDVVDDATDLSDGSDMSDGSDSLLEEESDDDTVPFDGDFERVVVIPKSGIELEATVDITKWGKNTFTVTEKLSFPAPAAGNTIKLFGEKLTIAEASVPFEYDKHTVLFFPGDFAEGDPLTIEATFSFNATYEMGMRIWENFETGDKVIGPFTEPYYTPYWLIVPQSPFKTDKDNDANVPVEKVKLSVVVPDEEWQVMGPGVTGTQEGTVWTFTMEAPMPFYALSFAASPDYTFITAGTSKSGVDIVGAGFSGEVENITEIYEVGVTTVDWMEEFIGPYEFGDKVGLVSIPDFGGGMEHVGVIYMGSDVLASYDSGLFVTVHEIVHNWWGNNVRFADWPDFWVAEGFDEWTTNYNLMGTIEEAAAFADRRDEYRTIAGFLCTAADAVPLRFDPDRDFMTLDIQTQSAYYYGAAFLEMVNKRLGRDFDGMSLLPLLKLWFEEKHQTTVTTEDFLAFLIAHTSDTTDSTDYWQALFDDWVYRAPCPTLNATAYTYEAGVLSFTLTHGGNSADLPQMPVTFLFADETSATVAVDITAGQSATVELTTAAEPVKILIDPEWYFVFALDSSGWTGPEIGFLPNAPVTTRQYRFPDAPKILK